MKLFLIPAAGLVVGLLSFPVLFASGDASLAGCGAPSGGLQIVLSTIRTFESGDDYTAQATGSSASGAYQFIDSTWGGYGGYQRAWQAPPAVQDARSAEHVQAILDRNGGDISAVPVVWYLGHLPPAGSAAWDTVPAPQAGNRLTPRQYQARWLDTYTDRREQVGADESGDEDSGSLSCLPGIGIAPLDGGWAYPAPADLFATAPVDNLHHTYPAWDWGLETGTPLYAVRGGTVTSIQDWPHNWWDRGCTAAVPVCTPCGIGVTITDPDGHRWTYCHGSALHVMLGQTVSAGTQLLSSGNTGRSSGPHLHLQLRTTDGQLRCPQPLLRSLRDDRVGVDPNNLPTTGCFY